MLIKHLVIPDAPPPRAPYSPAVVVTGSLLFISGQGPFTPDDKLVNGDFREQALRTFENVRLAVEGAGSDLAHVVRVGIYLADMSDFSELNELYAKFFPQPFPARTCVPSPLPRFKLEVDAIAVHPGRE